MSNVIFQNKISATSFGEETYWHAMRPLSLLPWKLNFCAGYPLPEAIKVEATKDSSDLWSQK